MTRRPHRNLSPAFKAKVALAAIRGKHTLENDFSRRAVRQACEFMVNRDLRAGRR